MSERDGIHVYFTRGRFVNNRRHGHATLHTVRLEDIDPAVVNTIHSINHPTICDNVTGDPLLGECYSGDFHLGTRHGQGIQKYSDGETYIGQLILLACVA